MWWLTPRKIVLFCGSCRNKPVVSELSACSVEIFAMKYMFETSDLWNTQKGKLCFIIYNYQSNYTTENPPIFKVTIIIKYIYVFSDIDECKGNHSCHANATCTNTNGSYVCECRPGFNGNGQNCKGEFNLFAVILRIFLLESNLTLLSWSLSAILLVCHM